MSRLQKKCLIATVGFHLLLIGALIFGSAFFTERPKVHNTHVLDMIPPSLVEAAFNSGIKHAHAAAPVPHAIVQPPPVVHHQTPRPAPAPPQPKPAPPRPTPQPKPVYHPAPKPQPKPVVHHEPKPVPVRHANPKPKPEPKPAPKPKPKPVVRHHKIKVNLHQITRPAHNDEAQRRAAEAAAREAKRRQEARLKAIANAASAIRTTLSSTAKIEIPGASSEAYANFNDALASIFYNAWTPPSNPANSSAITKVRLIIGHDGNIISARIIGPSGDQAVDASVQRAIDRVKSVPPLPDGASKRTIILNFNLKTKRMIG